MSREMANVLLHFTRTLGRGQRDGTELASDGQLSYVAFEDPDLEAVHVVTMGVSRLPVSALHPTEFVCSVRPGQQEAALHLVRTAVEMAARGVQLTLDSTMTNATPLLARTDIRGMLLSPGLWFEDLDLVEDEHGEIVLHVITLLPLIGADVAFLDSHDADDLYEAIDTTEADLLDVTRLQPIASGPGTG